MKGQSNSLRNLVRDNSISGEVSARVQEFFYEIKSVNIIFRESKKTTINRLKEGLHYFGSKKLLYSDRLRSTCFYDDSRLEKFASLEDRQLYKCPQCNMYYLLPPRDDVKSVPAIS